MKRVSPTVAALAVATSLTLVFLSSVTAFADAEHANPDNNGNHYGWVKHHNKIPAPVTAPPPATVPPPATTPPGANTPAPAGNPSANSGAGDTSSSTSTAVQTDPTVAVASPVVTIPVHNVQARDVTPARGLDWLNWLILLILPALIVVWLMVFTRAAITVSRRVRAAA